VINIWIYQSHHHLLIIITYHHWFPFYMLLLIHLSTNDRQKEVVTSLWAVTKIVAYCLLPIVFFASYHSLYVRR
jgi:hypothetical protein